jgi:aprataxin
MTHLHLHVISDDFDSLSLKTKKHWNSFTSPFFIPATTILDTLKSGKSIQLEKSVYDAYLDAPMQCHRCKKVQQNIPTLKAHLASCTVTQ